MSGYAKRIALIKTLKSGYSADGGPLKGLVRCEAYADFLKIETSLINFAPFSEGVMRIGVSDGRTIVVFEGISRESQTPFDLSGGFACLICYCRAGDVLPVACAVSGDMQGWLSDIESAIRQSEMPESAQHAYDDEAIAEENYYELETSESGKSVRPTEGEEKEEGVRRGEDGNDNGVLACEDKAQSALSVNQRDGAATGGDENCCSDDLADGGGKAGDAEKARSSDREKNAGSPEGGQKGGAGEAVGRGGLAGGDFYARMSGEIKKIFSVYPRADELEEVMEGSRWVKIAYGGGRHYAFGVLYDGGEARYICYGVPVEAGAPCPESLSDRAGYIPVKGGGYWVMYQDASTGVSVKVTTL